MVTSFILLVKLQYEAIMATTEYNDNGDSNGLRQRPKGTVNPTTRTPTSDSPSAKPDQQPPDKSLLQKLFSSKEEEHAMHIHKILGFSCLGSFAYRFAHLGRQDGNFGPYYGTLFFILHHWLLNASSFIFAIPPRRIRDGGYRIWPEFRIHSLVFASRSLAFMLLFYYEQVNNHYLFHMDLILVLATCAFADLGSYLQGPHQYSTVQGATFSDPLENWLASEMQLILTAFCIVGYRRYTLHLLAVSVIQTNSFLMTLRRKNVAGHYFLISCYSVMLIMSVCAITYDDQQYFRTSVGGAFGGVAALLRMGPLRVNKYLLWTGLYLGWSYIRTTGVLPFHNSWVWLNIMCATLTISTLVGMHKRSQVPKEQRSTTVAFIVLLIHVGLYAFLFIANGWQWSLY